MTNAKQTAEAAYENAHIEAQDLTDRVRDLLFELPAPETDEKISWALVGTVNEVNRQLGEIVAMLEIAISNQPAPPAAKCEFCRHEFNRQGEGAFTCPYCRKTWNAATDR